MNFRAATAFFDNCCEIRVNTDGCREGVARKRSAYGIGFLHESPDRCRRISCIKGSQVHYREALFKDFRGVDSIEIGGYNINTPGNDFLVRSVSVFFTE